MSANITKQGVARPLDKAAEGSAPFSETDLQDAPTLRRILADLFREVARQAGLWRPRRIDYEDRDLDASGTTKYRFEHRFGGRARYWIVSWSGAAAPNVRAHDDSDQNTLVLTSTVVGVATIRVEEAG